MNEPETQTLIGELNSLNVRHVLSDTILFELLSNFSRPERDKLIFDRVNMFTLPPLKLRDGLSWEVLLLSGEERRQVANQLKQIDDLAVKAKSFSITASRKEKSPEREDKLVNKAMESLKEFGFSKEMISDLSQVMQASQKMAEHLGLPISDWPQDPTPENLLSFSEKIKAGLGDELKKIQDQNHLYVSVTKDDGRPYDIAVDEAPTKVSKKLANTLRDAEHMAHFIGHVNEIDYLQIDRPQSEILKNTGSSHHIATKGLADRCFRGHIHEVADVIRKLSNQMDTRATS